MERAQEGGRVHGVESFAGADGVGVLGFEGGDEASYAGAVDYKVDGS